MDTILNLTIVQFLVKKKGDMLLLQASLILKKGRHACTGRVSLLLNYKKDCQQKILHGMLPMHTPMPILDTCSVQHERLRVEHKLFLIFKAF
jgi:hypothetical protein